MGGKQCQRNLCSHLRDATTKIKPRGALARQNPSRSAKAAVDARFIVALQSTAAAGGRVEIGAPHAACFDSVKWCRVENISPLLQIGVQLLPVGAGDYVVVCKTATLGIFTIYFRAQPILHELLWSYFLDEAYLLELVVLHPFFLVALDITFPPTKGLSDIL